MYQSILRPLLFRCDPEWVHNQAIRQAEFFGAFPPGLSLLSRGCGYSNDRLATEVCGLRFSNPIGLAAGYDKSGRAIRMMAALGFGHVEIGSVSAFPSRGNPKPRLWRLPADRAICVHYGLLNDGAEVVARRLTRAALSTRGAQKQILINMSEIFPNRHRAEGQALGSATHWVFAALLTTLFPMMVKLSGANEQPQRAGIIFLFFCFMMVLQLVWVKLMVPETKGVSLEAMQHKLGIE